MRRLYPILLLALGGLAPAAGSTAGAAPPPANVADLPTVQVSGVQPGPGMWRVANGDHVMYLLGSQSPLPHDVTWQSREVEAVLAGAQELIEPPKITLKVDAGFFGKLFLLPWAYGARKNADGRTLQDVLPPPLYARWQRLKQQYLGDERGIERWRPIFAAMELRKQALQQHGLRSSSDVQRTVEALAAQHGVRRTATDYILTIEHPRAAIAAFKQSAPGDINCFARTLESIEHDLPAITARANAWAVGDVEALRQMPDSHFRDACVAALTEAGFARQLGLDDVPAKVDAVWLGAVRNALANDKQSVAVLPMDELLAADGLLAKLKAQGYAVAAPDEDVTEAMDADAPANAASTASP